MKHRDVFITFDGTEFEYISEARRHESSLLSVCKICSQPPEHNRSEELFGTDVQVKCPRCNLAVKCRINEVPRKYDKYGIEINKPLNSKLLDMAGVKARERWELLMGVTCTELI